MDAVRESLAQQVNELRAENDRLREALSASLAVIGSPAPDHPPSAYVAKHEATIRAALTSPATPRP